MSNRNFSKIRVTQKDIVRLQKINKRIYNKRSRLYKIFDNRTGVQELFDTITVKELKAKSISRKQFNDYVKNAEKFLDRGNQYIQNQNKVILPKKQVEKWQKAVKKQNQLIAKRREKFIDIDTETGITVRQQENILMSMGTADELMPLSDDINKFTSLRDFNLTANSQNKRYKGVINATGQRYNNIDEYYKARDELLRYNYITALKKVYGQFDEISDELDELIQFISNTSIEDFTKEYYRKTTLTDIVFDYNDRLNYSKEQLFNRFISIKDASYSQWN